MRRAGAVLLMALFPGCGGPSASVPASVPIQPTAHVTPGAMSPTGGAPQAPSEAVPTPKPESGKSPLDDAVEAVVVGAQVETDPVPHSGDAADDPAVWVHPSDPTLSLVIGTDKKRGGGLATYDLSGRQLEYRADGAMNNVDVRTGFALSSGQVGIVAATRESDNTIATYVVDPATRLLSNVESQPLRLGITGYGGCLYRSAATAKMYFFANSDGGDVEQWELFDDGRGKVAASLVRSFDVGSQVEGCVADDDRGYFYIAEEDVGIWRYSAEPTAGTSRVAVDTTGPRGHLTADVEGLTIAYGAGDGGYLIASSQGDSSYSVYDRSGSNSYIGSFVIAASGTIDGTSDTDGIDVVTADLGSAFPEGVFVAQDGDNSGGNQNFKLARFGDILSKLGRR